MMTDTQVTLDQPIQQEYIPRNLMNHMNPYFAKQHHHAHSHGFHSHRHHHHHHHHHHNHNHNNSHRHTTPLSSDTLQANSYPTPTPSSCSSGFQTPVPRRSSIVHADPLPPSSSSSGSYNTPPATPPLSTPQTLVVTPGVALPAATAQAPAAGSRKEPVAWCTARARIPTPDGSEYFLHIYENSQDKKEHLAFVFGDAIRSRSLDKVQPDETEMDRVKRGAYTGRLQPIAGAAAADHSSTTLPLIQEQTTSTTSVASSTVLAETTAATTVLASDVTTMTIATTSTGTVGAQDQKEDAIMTMGIPLVRIHSECFTGEIGHSARCDCGEQLDEAIRRMKEEGAGVVVYLRQEGRGIGLGEKIKAYNLQDLGYDTVMANLLLNHGADERTYEVAQGILEDLGLDQIRLLTNNPDKIEQVERDSQIQVVERVPMMPKSWEAIEQGIQAAEFEVKEGAIENKIVKGKELDRYLKVKVERMRHLISIPGAL
ncbi:GTP cyclohydrolase II [Mortierella sp. NVP41]|nr:GTP cyclohydrolase II [Mortierella sp. NVP41]